VTTRSVVFLVLALAATFARPAAGVPAFARRYRVSCQLCHNPAPALNAFGEEFAGNGFRMSADEEPRDTIGTGDDLLWLFEDIPLALRLDAYVRTYANGTTATDFQTPWVMKLLSGGPISRKLSYYVYFLLFERGEVGGLEDAYVQVNDVAGSRSTCTAVSSRCPIRCSSVSCASPTTTTACIGCASVISPPTSPTTAA
jgi:hypothetical protein